MVGQVVIYHLILLLIWSSWPMLVMLVGQILLTLIGQMAIPPSDKYCLILLVGQMVQRPTRSAVAHPTISLVIITMIKWEFMIRNQNLPTSLIML